MYHNYILKNKFEENDFCYEKIVDLVEVIEKHFDCISTAIIKMKRKSREFEKK